MGELVRFAFIGEVRSFSHNTGEVCSRFCVQTSETQRFERAFSSYSVSSQVKQRFHMYHLAVDPDITLCDASRKVLGGTIYIEPDGFEMFL